MTAVRRPSLGPFTAFLITVALFLIALPVAGQKPVEKVLARVSVGARLTDVPFPVYAHLQGADGGEYALVFTAAQAVTPGDGIHVLSRATRVDAFVVALERRPGARANAPAIVEVLFDDGRQIVARASEAQAVALTEAGFDITRLHEAPMVLTASARAEERALMVYDANVAAMVAMVTQNAVRDWDAHLCGVDPVWVAGASYTITTRNTYSGTPIQKATQYAYEWLQSFGLATTFHDWSNGGANGRNVIGELPGTVTPSQIVIVCGHIDDMPVAGAAPGADDNASGSVGVLMAAQVLSNYRFEKTIRFVLLTGEEQGLFGSYKYAQLIKGQGANVVAVLNLDMISWDSGGSPSLRLHTRLPSNPGYSADLAIANVFKTAVNDYLPGGLSPIDDPDGEWASDHSSFWNFGYPALLAIEDDYSDFNPYYHTVDDTLAHLNMPYFTNFVKASLATAAHIAVPVDSPPTGTGFYPLTPCRLIDTRGAAGALGGPAMIAGLERIFTAAGSCGIPADARALAVNVTTTGATQAGDFSLSSASAFWNDAFTLPFTVGRTRANNAIVALPSAGGSTFKARLTGGGTAHLIVDVAGYFK